MGAAEQLPLTRRCPCCAETICFEAKKCKHCGEWIDTATGPQGRVISFPKRETTVEAQPGWHFTFLYLVSFGFYEFVWAYRMWKLIKQQTGKDLSPFWRALFTPIFIYSLSREVFKLAEGQGIKPGQRPSTVAVGYWILHGLYRLPGFYWLLSFLSGFQVWAVQRALNGYVRATNPAREQRRGFTGGEVTVLLIGGILWAILLLVPETA